MGSILKQLVGWRGIEKELRETLQEGKEMVGESSPLLVDLVRMLKITIASLPQVFICIDAIDQCLPKNLPGLLESLRDIIREFPRTKIFLTGRPHVWQTIQRYFSKVAVISIRPNQDDIRNYLEMMLDKDEEPEAMNDDLRADIVKTILDKVSDM